MRTLIPASVARRLALAGTLAGALAAALPAAASAQERDTTAAPGDTAIDYTGLPRDVAGDVRDVAESPSTLRVRGDYVVERGRTVNGDVLARDGTLTVQGTVAGRIVAVDADVAFAPGSSVGGDVLAVRGAVSGQAEATVGGTVRVYAGGLRGLVDVVRGEAAEDWRWLRRWRERHRRSGSELTITTGRTYNRVEGLPLYVGPTLRQRTGPAHATLRAFGVLRTAHGPSLTSEGAGHLVTADVRFGGTRGVAVGGASFDRVDAVEAWQLPDDEVGFATVLLHRDYRDYFNRHGADARLTLFAGPDADLTLSYGDQRWASVADRDPFSVLRNPQAWRPNPRADEGRFHVAAASARVDTRNRVDDPWAGWYLQADYERGDGRVASAAPRSDPADAPGAATRYGRGFLDVRRYNRLAPGAQLNLRLVLGGWLHGDPLPLQRRVSVGGPGTIPGFDFRRATGRDDVQQCRLDPALAPPGAPAECDRVGLVQAEYRGDLGLNVDPFGLLRAGPGAAPDASARRFRGRFRSEWVVFFDAGRGWRVGERQGALRYPNGALPPLRTFRSDVGLGLVFGTGAAALDQVGIYVAKAVSDAAEPANVVLRLRRRF